jgi:FMN phosphatase YigB (HAD superfamily)
MRCRYVFVDVADTLLIKPDLVDTLVRILNDAGEPVDQGLVRRNHKTLSECTPFPVQTSRDFYDRFNRELLFSLGIIPTSDLLSTIYSSLRVLQWRAADDISALGSLKVPIGIISNFDATLEERLRILVPIPFIKIVSSQRSGVSKPSLELFRIALDGLDCPPGDVAYVGDSLKLDIEPATSAGMTAILIDRHDLFPGYRGFRITTLFDLPKLVQT